MYRNLLLANLMCFGSCFGTCVCWAQAVPGEPLSPFADRIDHVSSLDGLDVNDSSSAIDRILVPSRKRKDDSDVAAPIHQAPEIAGEAGKAILHLAQHRDDRRVVSSLVECVSNGRTSAEPAACAKICRGGRVAPLGPSQFARRVPALPATRAFSGATAGTISRAVSGGAGRGAGVLLAGAGAAAAAGAARRKEQ